MMKRFKNKQDSGAAGELFRWEIFGNEKHGDSCARRVRRDLKILEYPIRLFLPEEAQYVGAEIYVKGHRTVYRNNHLTSISLPPPPTPSSSSTPFYTSCCVTAMLGGANKINVLVLVGIDVGQWHMIVSSYVCMQRRN